MLLGELLRNNNDIDRVAITIKALELFAGLDYNQAEDDLDRLINNFGEMVDTPSLLSDIDERIKEHLHFILLEYGITLNEDHNASMSELYYLVNGIESLTKYEQPEELLDVLEAQEDDIERLVELLSLVVKDMDSGNVYDYYNIVESVVEEFWSNLVLVVEGTREEIVDFDAVAPEVKAPATKGIVWEWISMSGRTGYNLRAALTLLMDTLDDIIEEAIRPDTIQKLCFELKTLLHYSSAEDKSNEALIALVEEITTDPDALLMAQGFIPYTELELEE